MRLLEEDVALAGVLSEDEREVASRYAVAECLQLRRGVYAPRNLVRSEELLGLLVLDGLMVRQVAVGDRRCGELIGPRAILRPWDDFGRTAPMPFEVSWRVVEDMRMALLDRRFLAVIVHWPRLIEAVMERTVERAQTLAFDVAIHCLQHVELRLQALLWHLADRYGKVTPEGIDLPLPLSHADLAELVGAARPSVSTALKQLAKDGLVWRASGGRTWMLSLEPPSELRDMRRQRQTA